MIIDVRSKCEFDKIHIPGSVNINFTNLRKTPGSYLDKLFTYYIVCENGMISKKLETYLLSKGYSVKSIKGGINSLKYLYN